MDVRTAVVDLLRERFPAMGFPTGVDTLATLESPNPDLETLEIAEWEDGILVAIGQVGHQHFHLDDSQEDARALAEDVVGFLDKLFSDRILVWQTGSMGGCKEVGNREPRARWLGSSYLWSRTLKKRAG